MTSLHSSVLRDAEMVKDMLLNVMMETTVLMMDAMSLAKLNQGLLAEEDHRLHLTPVLCTPLQ